MKCSSESCLTFTKAILQDTPGQSVDKAMVKTGYSTLISRWQWWPTTCCCWVCPCHSCNDRYEMAQLATGYVVCYVTVFLRKDNEDLLAALRTVWRIRQSIVSILNQATCLKQQLMLGSSHFWKIVCTVGPPTGLSGTSQTKPFILKNIMSFSQATAVRFSSMHSIHLMKWKGYNICALCLLAYEECNGVRHSSCYRERVAG